MFDVFLSHNGRQKPWVREFALILKNGGINVFFDEESVRPGEDIIRAIEFGVEKSRHVILVITPSSLASQWVAMETAITVYQDPDASRRVLIPLILERVDRKRIPPSIRRLNCVDLSDPENREIRFHQLIRSLGMPDSALAPMPAWPEPDLRRRDLSVASLDDVLNWDWDGNRLLDEVIRIDYETLDQLKAAHEGNTIQWAPVFTDHPDTWRLLVTSPGDIAGYWHFVPLFEPEYEQAKLGQLHDSQITTDKVRFFEMAGSYNIYFVSICILPRHRGALSVRLLFDSLFTQFTELASNGIFVGEICANAYTATGVALCKSFGLTYLREHVDCGKIYVGTFDQLFQNGFLDSHPELKRLYRK